MLAGLVAVVGMGDDGGTTSEAGMGAAGVLRLLGKLAVSGDADSFAVSTGDLAGGDGGSMGDDAVTTSLLAETDGNSPPAVATTTGLLLALDDSGIVGAKFEAPELGVDSLFSTAG